jgi:hypothetical protein
VRDAGDPQHTGLQRKGGDMEQIAIKIAKAAAVAVLGIIVEEFFTN